MHTSNSLGKQHKPRARSMLSASRLALLGVVALLGAQYSQAVTISDIRITGGLISGSLNSTPFTEQPWLLEGQADLSTATFDQQENTYNVSLSSVTITIGASGNPTALSGTWQLLTFEFEGGGVAGFCERDGANCIGGGLVGSPQDLFFDPSTLSLPYSKSGNSLFNTATYSSGVLVVSADSSATGTMCIGAVANCGSFAVNGGGGSGGSVPEPTTLALLSAGLLGACATRRQRRAAA